MTTAIANVEAARRALQLATKPFEAQEIRDKALGLEHYARVAKDHDLEVTAAEIRVRAERRIGELLVETPKNPGGRPAKVLSNAPLIATLEQLGISKDHSSLCQRLARVPLERFEAFLKERRLLNRPARAMALFAPWGVSTGRRPLRDLPETSNESRWQLSIERPDGATVVVEARGDRDLNELVVGAKITSAKRLEVLQ